MKIRLTGTRDECDRFTTELIAATPAGVIREVSDFYPNRGTGPRTQVVLGRVYLDLELPSAGPAPGTPSPSPTLARGVVARSGREGRR